MTKILLTFILAFAPAYGQCTARVQGVVRDAHARPVAAVVRLKSKAASEDVTTKTDVDGSYGFRALCKGAYTVRAESSVFGAIDFGPFVLQDDETKHADLAWAAGKTPFYDEPSFVVAGVTDAGNRGGHGSDTVPRSAQALAKATAALGGVDEQRGNALEAVRAYQRAAVLDPSERNLFVWGAELLTHRANQQAIEVFGKGNRLFHSVRMLLGLAAAWYAQGSWSEAARYFFEACDVDPGDPHPYLFLGKAQSAEIVESDGYVAHMKRFATMQPHNALANYYYAVSLSKRRQDPEDAVTRAKVEQLLNTAVRLDPTLAAAFLQLGILYAEQEDFGRAIAVLKKATAASPASAEAHYRLGRALERVGEKQKAQGELARSQELAKKSAEEAERQRQEIPDFVIQLRDTHQ